MHAPGRPNSDDPTRPADPRGERAAASLTDVRGEVPDFFQGLHGTIARALNCFRDRRDAFWEAKQYGRVELLDEETVLEKMVYVAANPVAAGLVDRGEKWPGIRLLPDASGRRVIRVEKPEFFFQQDEGLPEEVQVVIERPVHHDYPDNAEFAARLDEKIEAREKELRGGRRGQELLRRRAGEGAGSVRDAEDARAHRCAGPTIRDPEQGATQAGRGRAWRVARGVRGCARALV